MVLMTLGGELGGEGGNPWHHLLGASLNLSNVYVSCYTHMQMELYCSQLAAVSRHLPQLMGLCYTPIYSRSSEKKKVQAFCL